MYFYKDNTLFSIEQHTGNITTVEDHFHDLYEFYYLEKGTATYLINDKIYNLTKGDILAIPPNTLHKTISSSNNERKRTLFYLDKRFISSFISEQEILPDKLSFYHEAENIRLKTIFSDMLTEFNTINKETYLKILICELLIILQRTKKNTMPALKNDDLPSIISNALTYIATNYPNDITLQSISNNLYINSSYMSRLFKQHTGFTFCDYLNKYRINEANKLLIETNKSITEIAFECGFNSSNNFCKCYKKNMKISPLSYRNHIKKQGN